MLAYVLGRLSRIDERATVKTAFGDPLHENGRKIIPRRSSLNKSGKNGSKKSLTLRAIHEPHSGDQVWSDLTRKIGKKPKHRRGGGLPFVRTAWQDFSIASMTS